MLTQPQVIAFDVPNIPPPNGGTPGEKKTRSAGKPSVKKLPVISAPPPAKGNSHSIVCYLWGDGFARRTALCVHGLTRNGRDFDFLAKALASGYRILCLDMPGRGLSDWCSDPTQYSYPAYVADILYILKLLKLTGIDWVGTSMGGIIGMMVANSAPGVIRSLVLNDVGCVISGVGMKRILSYPPAKNPCPSRAEAEATLRERCDTFGIHDEAHWQHLFTYGIQEKNGCFKPAYDPAIMTAYNKERKKDAVIEDADLWGLWEAVAKIPVLLLRGAESDILTRETAQAMQSRHSNLTLKEISGCGHTPALMDDTQTTMVKKWLTAQRW